MNEELGKESMYVIDGFSVIDYIHKNNPDVYAIEVFIRNHMRPGHYDEPKKSYPERDKLYFHDQVQASKIISRDISCDHCKYADLHGTEFPCNKCCRLYNGDVDRFEKEEEHE